MKGDENLNTLYTAGLAAGIFFGIVLGLMISFVILISSKKV
ncbi:hypothetical protein Tmath_0057 [Thermoanaerobacter mathranii subsp. mathranii str. A3]|uniref:Tetrahydromethanopterin S-methyltransferase n=1 Tax=Thermoanaerobacter mathranii subsp. mathranii (strain DSM 11426 / CCUG 53645 / CIP 108742 / A3) TaxID=583358 RepID=A0ABN3Z142_THEM3|nr:hypothetical protein [Thermoanaerobacter mathranii]ADH59844.1 hypothetical protein Tmath_0057 [Thermoanaerobacter mathranii subsp. mathranii str. A3]